MARRVLAEATRDLEAADAWLWALDDDADSLRLAITSGRAEAFEDEIQAPIAGSIVGMVLDTGQWSIIGPEDWHNPEAANKTGIRTHSMVAVPVEIDDEPVGVLSVVREHDPSFEPEDAETVMWKATLVAAVIANAARVSGQVGENRDGGQ